MANPTNPKMADDKREIFGWTMYDWANSAFSTTVITVFLGPYLSALAEGAADANGLIYLGNVPIHFNSYFTFCISASVLLQVTLLPILGALADYSHLRKKMMMFFSTLGAVSTIAMFFLTPGLHWLGGLLLILANVAFGASIVFYNAYLPDIASEDQRDNVSAKGFALGYLGGGLLLLLNLVLFMFGEGLGLDGAMVARISLASAGFWWLGFSFVTFRLLRSRHEARPLPEGETFLSVGFSQLGKLLQVSSRSVAILVSLPILIPVLFFLRMPIQIVLLPALGPLALMITFIIRKGRVMPEAMKYMVAYLLYNDGIQTVIAVSAIFASQELGMETTQLILVILMIQFVAYFGANGFARLAGRIGTKQAIIVSLVIWTMVSFYAWGGMKNFNEVAGLGIPQAQLEFWVLGFIIALVLGGSQALSRSLFSQMIPDEQEAEFFSFYEVSERGTSWMGTFIFGLANQVSGSLRVGVLSVVIFFFAGLAILPLVNVAKAIKEGKDQSGNLIPAGGD